MTCSERLLDGKVPKKKDSVPHSNLQTGSPDPSEGNLTKQMDEVQVISMIGEILKTS